MHFSYILTDMYDRVPTKELARESINCPLTPKSQILISPLELISIFEGFTSATQNIIYTAKLTQITINNLNQMLLKLHPQISGSSVNKIN